MSAFVQPAHEQHRNEHKHEHAYRTYSQRAQQVVDLGFRLDNILPPRYLGSVIFGECVVSVYYRIYFSFVAERQLIERIQLLADILVYRVYLGLNRGYLSLCRCKAGDVVLSTVESLTALELVEQRCDGDILLGRQRLRKFVDRRTVGCGERQNDRLLAPVSRTLYDLSCIGYPA